jgi:hypothetical protein
MSTLGLIGVLAVFALVVVWAIACVGNILNWWDI